MKNEYLYNDKELWTDADLNWYDYGFRNYDPQIGRFPQLDPLTWDYPYYTPYQYAGNEPIANVDLDGLEPLNSTINTAIGEAIVTKSSFLSEVVIKGVSKTAPAVAKTSKVTTRIFGGLKAVGGILEAAVGVAGGIATSWTGVGAVGGGLVAAHGLDVAASGINQLIFGTESKSFTEQGINKGLQISGMSEDRANQWAGNIDGGISIVGAGYAGGGVMRGAPVVSGSVATNGGVQVEQYALRAAEDGFYPVMKRGFANSQELSWLNKGDVWKFGTTKNPLTRYSQSFLDNTGSGLRYSTEFSGTLKQATTLERMKILNFKGPNGFLPAGNKIIR